MGGLGDWRYIVRFGVCLHGLAGHVVVYPRYTVLFPFSFPFLDIIDSLQGRRQAGRKDARR